MSRESSASPMAELSSVTISVDATSTPLSMETRLTRSRASTTDSVRTASRPRHMAVMPKREALIPL